MFVICRYKLWSAPLSSWQAYNRGGNAKFGRDMECFQVVVGIRCYNNVGRGQ